MPGRTRSFRPSRTEQVSSARFRLPRADCYLWAALIAHPGGRGDRREGERGEVEEKGPTELSYLQIGSGTEGRKYGEKGVRNRARSGIHTLYYKVRSAAPSDAL